MSDNKGSVLSLAEIIKQNIYSSLFLSFREGFKVEKKIIFFYMGWGNQRSINCPIVKPYLGPDIFSPRGKKTS